MHIRDPHWKLGILTVTAVAVGCLLIFTFTAHPGAGRDPKAEDAVAVDTGPELVLESDPEGEGVDAPSIGTEDRDGPDGDLQEAPLDGISETTDMDTADDTYSAAFVGMTEEEIAAFLAQAEDAAAAYYDSTPVSYAYDEAGDPITIGTEERTEG